MNNEFKSDEIAPEEEQILKEALKGASILPEVKIRREVDQAVLFAARAKAAEIRNLQRHSQKDETLKKRKSLWLSEYLVFVAAVFVASIVTVSFFGGKINSLFSQATSPLGGSAQSVSLSPIQLPGVQSPNEPGNPQTVQSQKKVEKLMAALDQCLKNGKRSQAEKIVSEIKKLIPDPADPMRLRLAKRLEGVEPPLSVK